MLYSLGRLILSGSIIEEFVVELLIAEAVFCWKRPRREGFFRRCLFAVILLLAVSFYWPYKQFSQEIPVRIQMLCILRYNALFFLSVAGIMYCYSCGLNDALFCGVGAYAMQHFAYCVIRSVCVHLEHANVSIGLLKYCLIAFLACTVTYTLFYALFVRRIQREHIQVTRGILLPALIVVVFTSSINLYTYNDIACKLCGIVICILTVWILAGIFQNSKLEQELNAIRQLRSLKEEYYSVSRENIEAINMHCHDLKHQIIRIRNQSKDPSTDRYLAEVEDHILIYDAVAQTSNLALDTILTDKSLYCEKNGIKLVYMVDGEKLAFMEEADIYNLFGNALDNAIESVMKINDQDERVVSLTVKTVGNLLSIHLDNAFSGTLNMEDGLPTTTKAEPKSHGYGLKSMRMTAEKYGGRLTVSAEHALFNLNIVIPIP